MIPFINGSINSGKSTVAKILASKIPNTALLEIDVLREIINWMTIDQAVLINLENAVSIIKNLSKRNINVIVPYPLSNNNYNYVLSELENINTKLYFFTLSPNLEKVIINRGNRELNNQEIERIKYHYSIGINNPSFGDIIDNGNQTLDETANYIISVIS